MPPAAQAPETSAIAVTAKPMRSALLLLRPRL